MTLSKAQRKANDKYIADHYSRIALSMPNDEATALREYCAAHGLTVAGFIRGLIRDAIAVDPAQAAAPVPQGDAGGADAGRVTRVSIPKEEKAVSEKSEKAKKEGKS